MFGARFHHSLTKKYVAIFGTLFNDIVITRDDGKTLRVPMSYGPTQKFLSPRQEDPDHNAPAVVLPRLAFEFTSYAYDPERNLTLMPQFRATRDANTEFVNMTPAPYNLEFNLYVMAKTLSDGYKIVETILPYFKPTFTVSAHLLDGVPNSYDVPIVLNSVSCQDDYESSFEQGRMIVWTLSFTIKGFFFGPNVDRKIIKFVDTRTYATMEPDALVAERATVFPGMTPEYQPTTDPDETIPWQDISADDDWAAIVVIE